MRVKLMTIMAGPEHIADAGATVDLQEKLAKQLIASGQAEAAPVPPVRKAPERATRQAPEHRDGEAAPPAQESPAAAPAPKPAKERLV